VRYYYIMYSISAPHSFRSGRLLGALKSKATNNFFNSCLNVIQRAFRELYKPRNPHVGCY